MNDYVDYVVGAVFATLVGCAVLAVFVVWVYRSGEDRLRTEIKNYGCESVMKTHEAKP